MAGLFAKSAEKSAEKPASKKPQTLWNVGTDERLKAVGDAVGEMVKIKSEMKSLETRLTIHKSVVQAHARRQFVNAVATNGVMPPTPMKVVNDKGQSVTYVVQDKSGQYSVSADEMELIASVIGKDAAESITYTETDIKFKREVMAIPGVSEVVEKALETAIAKLLKAGILNEETADNLIEVDQKLAIKPGTFQRIGDIAGRDVPRVDALIDAMGNKVVSYVKV